MKSITKHVSRCLVAGIVALLPIAGVVFTVVYLESTITGSWLEDKDVWWYFPGLGILAVVVLIYIIGLIVSSFLGRWLWTRVDRLLERVPALGQLYQTLKQILGYGEGEEALFQKVVMVKARDHDAEELGLVTGSAGKESEKVLTVFVPGVPNPTAGRLIMVASSQVRDVDVSVSDAMRSLVSLGTLPLEQE